MYGRGHGQGGFGGGGVQFGPPVTPPVIKQLLIANGAVFVLQVLSPALVAFGAVQPFRVFEQGWLWQPFTYMWLHGGFAHIGFNMLALWMFGSPMALAWGPRKFLRFYLTCGVGAGVLIALWPYIAVWMGLASSATLGMRTLGASGAVFGVLLAYTLTWPDRYIMLLFPPIPIKAIYFIPLILFLELASPRGNISTVGHLGGVLVGWILMAREGRTQGIFSLGRLKYRLRRWRMRRKLQAVRNEERRFQERRHNDTLH